jgi:hypothetical protein
MSIKNILQSKERLKLSRVKIASMGKDAEQLELKCSNREVLSGIIILAKGLAFPHITKYIPTRNANPGHLS